MNGTTKPARAMRTAQKLIFNPLPGDRRGRETGQRHRRGEVGEDAEVEDEHVRDDQRHPSSSSAGAAMELVMM